MGDGRHWLNSVIMLVCEYNQMKGAQIANVLSRTLSPSTIESSSRQLASMRGGRGFAVELLVICDSLDYTPAVRQSALIYLKNTLQDHCSRQPCIPAADLADLKANLLEAIIRNVTNKQLAPTLREIVFQMAEKYYPREWPEIVDDALRRLTVATEFNEILGCVQTLRAIFSVFGGSVMKEIELGNLCNRAVLPLLGLASRLFQSFSAETSLVLLSVLKLFSAAIQFHLPGIVAANIHNLMIFVKKVLDLGVILDDGNIALYYLKRICLRILFRLYQRHANPRLTGDPSFAQQFHAKYTRSFVETLVYQVLAEGGKERGSRHRQMELMRMALSCLAYINRQSIEAAGVLLQHRHSLVELCLQRLKLNFDRTYQSFVDFRLYVHESRVQLKEFFFSLMRCEALPDQQPLAVTTLLGLLLGRVQGGDSGLKELALYIFAEMSAEVQFLKAPLDDNMIQLIVGFVPGLLGEDQPALVRMRACHLLASYNYLDLPEESVLGLATAVYSCLLVQGGEKESFLRIYACSAFNSLLKYPSIVDFVRPHLQDILRIYTSLLESDVSIIKNFEDLLNLLEDEIAPFANDLVLVLVNLFHNYAKQDAPQQHSFAQGTQSEQDEEDEEESVCEDDSNNESIAKACISSIRQILQAERAQLGGQARDQLFRIVVEVFADRSQLYIEEGYNILNLLLYKLEGPLDDRYYLFFKTIAYALLGLPPTLVERLRRGNNDFDRQYCEILENICIQPDNDLLENSIGCLRNFVAKSPREALRGYRDQLGTTILDSVLRIVRQVHENEGGKSSQTDRLIVLTLYVTLVEHHVLQEGELAGVIGQVLGWMQMEQQAVEQQGPALPARFVYSAVYLQIVLLAVHAYGRSAIDQLDLPALLLRVLFLQENFRCDYELARVLVGVADLLSLQAVNEERAALGIMRALPQLVRRACRLRQEGDDPLNDREMDDQAEEERLMGNDENSMMLGWQKPPAASEKDLQLGEQEEEDNDWEEQFNKFYDSPLDKIDQIRWLENALKGEGRPYLGFLSTQLQDDLALYFANAPPKQ